MNAYIIDAWECQGDREDDDAYEGCMSLGPPNNVAPAYARKDQRAASATTPLPISAYEESACAAGRLCNPPDHADLNSLTHRCLNCRGKIHCALWCGNNWGEYVKLANFQITPDQLSAAGRATLNNSDHELITICNGCVNSLDSPNSLDEPHADDEQAAAMLASSTKKMTVSTIEKHLQAKLPIVSTANKINAKTAAKKRVNKGGEVVADVKVKEPRIKNGVWIFSTKSQLISLVKQDDPCYNNLFSATSNRFQFYGTVLRADARKGW